MMKRLCILSMLLLVAVTSVFAAEADTWYMVPGNSMNINLQENTSEENLLVASLGVVASNQSKPVVRFEFPDDFCFVSTSQPYFRIPFGLNIVVNQQNDNGNNETTTYSCGYDDNGNLTVPDNNELVLDDELHIKGQGGYIEILVYLVLPDSYEDFNPGPASDYFTRQITVSCPEDATDKKTYSIVMQGYYETEGTQVADSVIFSVTPGANARTINISALLEGQSVEVGVYNMTTISESDTSDDSSPYYIYALGSSFFDDERASHFRLTNTTDQTSSFQYTVTLISDASGEGTDFTGFLDFKDISELKPTEKRIETMPDGNSIATCYGSGTIEISVNPENVPDNLSAGYYSSDIYFHVVSAL